jgi:hypothetical protein
MATFVIMEMVFLTIATRFRIILFWIQEGICVLLKRKTIENICIENFSSLAVAETKLEIFSIFQKKFKHLGAKFKVLNF